MLQRACLCPSLGSHTLGHHARHDAGYFREEPGAGKPPARICEGEAKWPSYSTTTWRNLSERSAVQISAQCIDHPKENARTATEQIDVSSTKTSNSRAIESPVRSAKAKCAQPGECGLAARQRAEVLKDIAVRWGAIYLTRADNCQAKAGNINGAR